VVSGPWRGQPASDEITVTGGNGQPPAGGGTGESSTERQ
jgi:hypothetical protein